MKFFKLPLLLPALLCVIGIRLLAKFGILIRLGEFWSERVGHLAGNSENYLCQVDAGLHPKAYDIWFHRSVPACKQIARMYGRVMRVDHTKFSRLVSLVNSMFKGWEKHMCSAHQVDRDIYNLYEIQKCHISFTPEEKKKGEKILRKWGIPEGSKWVCLIVRDGAYLPTLHYHSYRDSNVQDYLMAALELAEKGYYVFRMGAKVEKKFKVHHPKIIDYATDGRRSDFMDAYLGANCEFCISSGTGFDAIPVVFRKPVCFVNYVPIEYLNTWVKGVAIFKHHYKGGKRMTLDEIYQSGASQFMASHQFKDEGIVLVDNSPDEIADAVVEMIAMVEGPVDYSEAHQKQQEEFWKSFPRSSSPYNGRPLHGKVNLRIGAKFLESYEQTRRIQLLAESR